MRGQYPAGFINKDRLVFKTRVGLAREPAPVFNTVELRSRSASLCRLGTRLVSAAKDCRPKIWFVSVLNSTVLAPVLDLMDFRS